MENEMTDTTNPTPPALRPYDELLAAGRTAMLALYADKATAIKSGKLWRIEEGFTRDALSEKGKYMFLERFEDDRQREEIGAKPAAIFEGLSQSMIDFYRRKLDDAK
jgi:hypothetical protein